MDAPDRSPPGLGAGLSRAARTPPIERIPSLDGLRGLAILWVVMERFNCLGRAPGDSFAFTSLLHILGTGWVGVQLFFVLSGYLITAILLETRSARNYLSAFYLRRALRIFPLYYGFLLVMLVLVPRFSGGHPPSAEGLQYQVWAWTFLLNWTEPFGYSILIGHHLWSLAVEEQFYLLWPLVVRYLGTARLAWLCSGLTLLALALRVAVWELAGPAGAEVNYMFTICRMDALAVGAGCAALLNLRWGRALIDRHVDWLPRFAAAAIIGGYIVTRGFPRTSQSGQTIGYTLLALAFGALVLAEVARHRAGPRQTGPWLWRTAVLRSLGKYSFGMYILHAPLHKLVGRPLLIRWSLDPATDTLTNVLYMVCGITATYLAAVISYYAWEQHFLRLKPAYSGRVQKA